MITFDCTKEEYAIIDKIVKRVAGIYKSQGHRLDRLSAQMDLSCVHSGCCPLRLDDILAADDFNICHDVFGIAKHLNRETGELDGHFRPRFAKRAKAEGGA